jgi:hypothetical protein
MSDETRSDGTEEEPRIQVDEDWKKSVADEKEKLREQAASEPTAEPEAAPEEADRRPRGPLPEPDVQTFISGLYMQTLAALGAIENPLTGKRERNPDEAAYMIDTVGMLREKMKGNLTPEEEAYVQNILTDLRMRFVAARQEPAQEPEEGAD